MAFCTECGKELTEGELFCTECGKKLSQEETGEQKEFLEKEDSETKEIPETVGEKTQSVDSSENSQSGKRLFGIIPFKLAVILGVLIVVFLTVCMFVGFDFVILMIFCIVGFVFLKKLNNSN